MKAVVVENYDSIDGISIKEIEMPGISAGEVRVKIGAAAVGFVDGLKVQGLYQTKDPLPFVPGTEIPRVRPVPLGPRNIGYLDAEIDELIDAIAELRDAVTRHHGAAGRD
jgi:predicted DNA-binding transcriptional regulator AlpA